MKFLVALFCFVQIAQARVFDMKETSFGGYFNATYGNSEVKKDYFTGESTATSFSKGFNTNMGGEFGFIYNTGKISWLFGLEIIKPAKTRGAASTGATANYDYTADVSVYIPKAGVELVLYQDTSYRIFANAAVGTGSLSTKNQYSNLTIAPNTDFSFEGKGSANSMNYSVGSEVHWTDNTTFLFSIGNRQLNFKKVTYLADVASSFTGAHTKGQQIMKNDGTALGYDFSNYYLTIGLRFWIH